MTSVSIVPEESGDGSRQFRAISGEHQSTGDKVGQAIDAITAQLPDQCDTLVIVQRHHPDQFFSESQHARLSILMEKWRDARDKGKTLPSREQAELEALVEAEVRASGDRAEFIHLDLQK